MSGTKLCCTGLLDANLTNFFITHRVWLAGSAWAESHSAQIGQNWPKNKSQNEKEWEMTMSV